MQQLREYVAAPASGMQNKSDSTVLLNISHSNLSSHFMEIRLDLHVKPSTCSRSIVAHAEPSMPHMLCCAYLEHCREHKSCAQMTVDAVKSKLTTHCGTSPSAMVLQLKDQRGSFVATLDHADRKLGYYSPLDR